MLIAGGTADPLADYDQMVSVFNRQTGPKAMLTLEGASHTDWLQPGSRWYPSTVAATTDFFSRYLTGSRSAGARLARDGQSGATAVHYQPQAGSGLTVATQPVPKTDRHASVTPSKELTDGQVVTVRWRGYLPGKVVNIVECSPGHGITGCDAAAGRILVPDPSGSGMAQLTVVEGTVGSGVCDPAHQGCVVDVNDAGLTAHSATEVVPITFARPAKP